jgi:hypothetical protein
MHDYVLVYKQSEFDDYHRDMKLITEVLEESCSVTTDCEELDNFTVDLSCEKELSKKDLDYLKSNLIIEKKEYIYAVVKNTY